MILVDVYVPVIDKVYDFHLEENVPTGIVIEDIAELICQREQYHLRGQASRLTLWLTDKRLQLEKSATLCENGIRSGDRLMLV